MSSSISDLDSWSQASFAPCSPCSSGSTCVHNAQYVPPTTSDCITVFLPNLVNRISVAVDDLEKFVDDRLDRHVDVTIMHLLVYLFSVNTDPEVTHINDIKLIHKGKPYTIQRMCDLQDRLPRIRDMVAMFPTFQLIISSANVRSPIKVSVDVMLSKMSTAAENDLSPSVTYAEAMVKLFKKLPRKLSIGLLDSQATTARYALRNSATDDEDNVRARCKGKLHKSFKRIFGKSRAEGPPTVVNETFLFLL